MTKCSLVSKVTIEPLKDTEKYSTWAIFVKELLNRDRLHSHIYGAKTRPPDSEQLKLTP